MKKMMIVIVALCLLLAMTACGAAETPAATGNQGQEAGNNATQPDASVEQFSFTYKDTKIALHAPAAPIVEALGEPMQYSESTSCAFDGLDKSYYYGSFYLETYPMGDEDFVYGWWFADDGVATNEGIYIGADQAQVEAAYGAENFNGTNAYIVNMADGRLTVILEEGVVTSIQYAILAQE